MPGDQEELPLVVSNGACVLYETDYVFDCNGDIVEDTVANPGVCVDNDSLTTTWLCRRGLVVRRVCRSFPLLAWKQIRSDRLKEILEDLLQPRRRLPPKVLELA